MIFQDFLNFNYDYDYDAYNAFLYWCFDILKILHPSLNDQEAFEALESYLGFVEHQLLYAEPQFFVYAYIVDMYQQYFQLEKLLIIYLYSSFFFLICLLFFAVCLLFIYNPIYSVINLILAYISAACTLIIWEVHFLAVVFILVYLGAVVVLFLFIVMMLNIKILSGFQILKGIPYLLFIVACIALCFIVYSGVKSASTNSLPLNFSILKTHEEMFKLNYVAYSAILFLDIVNQYTIQENFLISTLTADYKFSSNLAHVLYSFFGLELLYGALVLLIAMLGCIAVTFLIGQRLTQKQLYMDQLLQSSFLFLRG